MRRGISLLEVLISIAVLVVGLVGVFSLLPIAKFYAAEGQKYDRSDALADRAMGGAKLRGMAEPGNWIVQSATGPTWAAPGGKPDPAAPDMGLALVDPLGVLSSGSAATTVPPAAYSLPGAPVIPRVTLASDPTGGQPILSPWPLPLAERIMRGLDDLQFSRPTKDGERPVALPSPQPEAEGMYSWALLVRRPVKLEAGKLAFASEFLVDVLVCQKRDLTLTGPLVASPPPERIVFADIKTSLPSGNLFVAMRAPAGWEKTRRGQPVLLSTTINDPMAPGGSRAFAQWYIVSGGEGADVVLQGADWPAMSAGWSDADTSTAAPTVYATIFEGLALVREGLD